MSHQVLPSPLLQARVGPPPAIECIARLAREAEARGLPIAAATSGLREHVEVHLAHVGLDSLFSCVFSGPLSVHYILVKPSGSPTNATSLGVWPARSMLLVEKLSAELVLIQHSVGAVPKSAYTNPLLSYLSCGRQSRGNLVFAADVSRGKPAPDIFQEAARRIGARQHLAHDRRPNLELKGLRLGWKRPRTNQMCSVHASACESCCHTRS